MTRTKLILAGLIAGAMVFGTACKSDKAAERGEPIESTQGFPTDQGGAMPDGTNPGGTGGAGTFHPDDDGSGGSGTLNPENQDAGGAGDDTIQHDEFVPYSGVGDSDTTQEGTGGSGTTTTPKQGTQGQEPKDKSKTDDTGYRENDSRFQQDQELGGDKFPSDDIVPQP